MNGEIGVIPDGSDLIPLRIIDMADPNMPEELAYVRADQIMAVRPAKHLLNAADVQQEPRTLPKWKRFTGVLVREFGIMPCADPIEHVMHRLTGRPVDEFKKGK